jgi:hypothetical protein
VSAAEREALEAIPAVLTKLRRPSVNACESANLESEEPRRRLDACVVGAHRRRLRETLRAKGGCEKR